MAFLDETGLAELWSLIKAEDNKAPKVAVGSYVGTVSSTKEKITTPTVTLTMGFKPKLVIIMDSTRARFYRPSNTESFEFFIWVDGVSEATMYEYNGSTTIYPSATDDGFSFYCQIAGNNGTYGCLNRESYTYKYFAIG